MTPSAKEVAARIRAKVADLNDELILAKLSEVDVEFVINNCEDDAVSLEVWCSQEVR